MESKYTETEAEQMIMRVIALSDEKILDLLKFIEMRFPEQTDVEVVYDIRYDPDMYQWILAEPPKTKLLTKLKELESK